MKGIKNYNVEKQHKKGKLHAIERIERILNKDTFFEFGSNVGSYKEEYKEQSLLDYDGVITGYGYIGRKLVYIYSQDFTVCGGTVGKKHGEKIALTIKKAIENKCPIIGINDSGGARIQEGVNALAAYGDIFYYNTLASGYIPQISVVLGPCAGGAVYSPGITDFVFMVDEISHMFVTGPKVIQEVTGISCNEDELGGTNIHKKISGVSHFVFSNEDDCFEKLKKLISIIPTSVYDTKIKNVKYNKKFFTNIQNIVPKNPRKIYNIIDIINEVVDVDSFLEIQKEFATNIVVGFGKISEITVGIVANQPSVMAGVLDCDSSDKAARFVRYCDSFNIPIITLVDVPGFLPSVEQEKKGIIRHGAKLLYAYAEATTIKITIILRKAFGGAYIAMGSKHLRTDFVYAWPQSQISVMGAEGAVNVIYAQDLKRLSGMEREDFRIKKMQEYENIYMSSLIAEKEGYIDEILDPKEMRLRIFKDIMCLQNKQEIIHISKKHGNIPL